ncbi:type VI secretion system TssO [uncultured Marixanthomonas sp.]|uniref:type VI secretion system TssO n=1 Tax=uncultured Marixanthomonas sp. TaxID=757245 RepID=UPI0030DCEB0A|tara:strand:- start:14715 stop:15224 length:510 start_codon:yes stop_codon:yes gene_type:complete
MKAKNRKARRNSFLKFFLLFILTTAIIVVALFFDFNVMPFKENKVLRNQAVEIEKEIQFQEGFSKDIQLLRDMVDSLDIPGQNRAFLNSMLSSQIVKLQEKIPVKDSTYRYDMYNNVIWSFAEIQKLKEELNSYSDVEERITEYKEELEKCRDELKEEKRTVDALRRNN